MILNKDPKAALRERKINLDFFLTLYQKNRFEMDYGPNHKNQKYKILGKNIGEYPYNLGVVKIFFSKTQKKEKEKVLTHWTLSKLNNFAI